MALFNHDSNSSPAVIAWNTILENCIGTPGNLIELRSIDDISVDVRINGKLSIQLPRQMNILMFNIIKVLIGKNPIWYSHRLMGKFDYSNNGQLRQLDVRISDESQTMTLVVLG